MQENIEEIAKKYVDVNYPNFLLKDALVHIYLDGIKFGIEFAKKPRYQIHLKDDDEFVFYSGYKNFDDFYKDFRGGEELYNFVPYDKAYNLSKSEMINIVHLDIYDLPPSAANDFRGDYFQAYRDYKNYSEESDMFGYLMYANESFVSLLESLYFDINETFVIKIIKNK